MAITASAPQNLRTRGKEYFQVAVFQLTFSGSYTAGGDTVSLPIPTSKPPLFVLPITTNSGYELSYIPGTSPANGKIKVFVAPATGGGALVELTAGAYPSALTSDTVMALVVYPSLT